MKMLSIQQPWADVILYHGKNIENRVRNLRMRGFFAIHASMLPRKKDFAELQKDFKIKLELSEVQLGAIVGIAELVAVLGPEENPKAFKKWKESGNYGYVLKNIIPLKQAIPCKGGRGIWPVDKKIENLVLKQLSAKQRKMVMTNMMGSELKNKKNPKLKK